MYMRKKTGSSLVQVNACHLVGAKLLHEPMMIIRPLDIYEQISGK